MRNFTLGRSYGTMAGSLFVLLLIILFACALAWSSPAAAESNAPAGPGQALVEFARGVSLDQVRDVAASHQATLVREIDRWGVHDGTRLYVLRSPSLSSAALASALSSEARVTRVAADTVVEAEARYPNDWNSDTMWPLSRIQAPQAWDLTTGSSSAVVAVLDSGIDYTHPDLAANMWHNPGETPGNGVDDDGNDYVDDVYGIDTYAHDSSPADENWHGTYVSGVIGAVGNNGTGISGVNWSVKLMAIRCLDGADLTGTSAGAIEGAYYAVQERAQHGVNVVAINTSWGGGNIPYNPFLGDVIQAAGEAGIVWTASAGNEGSNADVTQHYPSGFPALNILSVAASNEDEVMPSWSNWGPTSVDLAAPGSGVWGTNVGGTYTSASGTSPAAAIAAGSVALCAAYRPGETALQRVDRIMTGVDVISSMAGSTVTGGRLNVFRSLSADLRPTTQVGGVDSAWHKGTVTAAFTANDGTGIGVDYSESSLNGGDYQSGSTRGVSVDGTNTLSYRSVDKAGNVETAKSVTVKVDNTAPVVTASGYDTAWHDVDVPVHISAVDPNAPDSSGVAAVQYREGATGSWTTAAGASTDVVVPAAGNNGVHTYQYRAVDAVGNVSDASSFVVKIAATILLDVQNVDGAWHQSPVDVLLTGVSLDVPVARIEYRVLGAAEWNEVPGAIAVVSVSGDGIHTYEARALDVNGAPSNTEQFTVKLDDTAPAAGASGFDGAWHNADVPIHLSAEDPNAPDSSGVVSVEYREGSSGQWTTVAGASADLVVSATGNEGVHTYQYRATDAIGNAASPSTFTVKIDHAAPTANATGFDDAWHLTDVTVHVTATDPNAPDSSGVASVEYREGDTGTWTSVTGASADVVVPEAGNHGPHTYQYRSIDATGNVSDASSFTVYIGRTVLIVAPHPDDDLLFGAGVAASALSRGDRVKVVYMTNGDALGASTSRQTEAVTAQTQHIGTTEDDLIFLGYPDGGLWDVLYWYPSASDSFAGGQSSLTYGSRGLGRTDYHNYRFGAHAAYNRANVLQDLESIIATYRPDDVYTTSKFDGEADHEATRWFVRTALQDEVAADPTLAPTLNTAIVDWPYATGWPAAIDPQVDLTEPFGLFVTGLSWAARESLVVPTAMQSTDFGANPKYLAIAAHVSQGGASGLLGRFIHRDEVFWVDSLTDAGNGAPAASAGPAQPADSQALVRLDGRGSSDPDGDPLTYAWTQTGGPAVALSDAGTARPTFTAPSGTASLTFRLVVSDRHASSSPASVTITVAPRATAGANIAGLAEVTALSQDRRNGQFAFKAVDGSAAGYPANPEHEWVALGLAGSWLELEWANPHVIRRVVLHDRPNANDQITAGTLRFSDGSTVPVAALPNDGNGLAVTFPARSVTSVRFEINTLSASSYSAGLAEIEVYTNKPPVASATAPAMVTPDSTVQLDGSASSDPDGDPLTYAWTQTAGPAVTLSDATGARPTFTAPSEEADLSFELVVNDGYESSSAATTGLTVRTSPISVTAPTSGSSHEQGAGLPVTWTTNAAVNAGEFSLWVVDPATGAWYGGDIVPASGPDAGSVQLNVPLGSTYFVRVYYRATIGSGAWTVYGQSAGSFSVVATGFSAISVTAPTSGSSHEQGAGLPVTWTTNAAVNAGEFSLWVVDPATGAWYGGDIVPASGPDAGSVQLNVPLGSTYFVRVYYRATIGSGAWTVYGQSAGSFSVVATGFSAISVTAPTSGSSHEQGAGLPVTWTTNAAVNAGEFSLWVVDPATGAWYGGDIVPASGPDAGSVQLNVPLGSTYFVRVYYRATIGSGAWTVYGQSAGSFSVVATGFSAISVTAPTSGSSHEQGAGLPVTWTTNAAVNAGEFSLWVVDPATGAWYGGDIVPASGPDAGSVQLNVPLGSTYFVRVYYRATIGSGAWTVYGQSAGSFSVVAAGFSAISVTAPTSGSSHEQGAGLPVTWTTNAAVNAGEFSLWVVDPATGAWYGGDIVPASGPDAGSVQLNVPLGSTYFVRVYYRATIGSGAWTVYGQSAGSFSVIP